MAAIRIQEAASHRLDEIWRYTRDRWGPDQADRYVRGLFEAFAEKRELLQLLERTAKAPGLRVFIGEETGLAPLEGMSLVSAPYGRDGQVLGVLGVIGPSRMAYERVIPVVEATAAVLGAALESPLEPPP